MPTNIPGNPNNFPANVRTPSAGDPGIASAQQRLAGDLADRTAYLTAIALGAANAPPNGTPPALSSSGNGSGVGRLQTLDVGVFVTQLRSTLALQGDVCEVPGFGLYQYIYSTVADDGGYVLASNTSAWTGGLNYAVGTNVTNGGNTYICIKAGQAAASGGPTGTGSSPITDNTCTWLYLSGPGRWMHSLYSLRGPIGVAGGTANGFAALDGNAKVPEAQLTTAPTAWASGVAYLPGDRVTSGGNVYECVGGGSSTSGGAPTGTGSAIHDHLTANPTWKYVSAQAGSGRSLAVATDGTARGVGAANNAGGDFTGGSNGAGVKGTAGSGNASGVLGYGAGSGDGVYGSSDGSMGGGAGVHGVGSIDTDGVHGEAQGAGAGVSGTSISGPGGQFAGNATRGAINLVPRSSATKPTSPNVGDLFFTDNGSGTYALWLYTSAGWKQVTV